IVLLNGSGSFDPDGDALIYNWTQLDGPVIALSNSQAASPIFAAPSIHPTTAANINETLTFILTVDDTHGGVLTDYVEIIVKDVNKPPAANAGPDKTV